MSIKRSNIEISIRRETFFSAISVLLLLAVIFQGISLPKNSQANEQETNFNRADLMFMNMMIIHHDQAIEMAELASGRTENQNIIELAENISEAQRSENEKMASWLREAGLNRPRDGHRMAGMATSYDMQRLENSEDGEFDMLFSELMIVHHEGGIGMARAVVENGKSEKVREIAQTMIRVQQEEVSKMEEWRTEWS